MHFHVCVVDGVFEAVVGEASEQGTRTTAISVMFHPAIGIDPEAVTQAQASLRRRILRAFVGRGLLEGFEAQEMTRCCRCCARSAVARCGSSPSSPTAPTYGTS